MIYCMVAVFPQNVVYTTLKTLAAVLKYVQVNTWALMKYVRAHAHKRAHTYSRTSVILSMSLVVEVTK